MIVKILDMMEDRWKCKNINELKYPEKEQKLENLKT